MAIVNFTLIPWLLVAGAGVNSCIGNILLKYSRKVAPDFGLYSLLFSPWFIAGLCFYALNVILFAKALDDLQVSSAYPVLSGLGFTMLSFFSFFFLNESISPLKGLGIILILIGIVCICRAG